MGIKLTILAAIAVRAGAIAVLAPVLVAHAEVPGGAVVMIGVPVMAIMISAASETKKQH